MTEFEIALLKELKRIGDNLEKLTEDNNQLHYEKFNNKLEDIAYEVEQFEPAMGRLLREYI